MPIRPARAPKGRVHRRGFRRFRSTGERRDGEVSPVPRTSSRVADWHCRVAPSQLKIHEATMRHTSPSRVGEDLARSMRWLVPTMLRALVLLLVFSLSGIAGAFEVGQVTDVRECCGDCPDESEGKECPPSCPSCHCAHGSLALPKQAGDRVAMRRDAVERVTSRPDEATAPRAPMLPGVYRPPRRGAFAL